MSMAPYQPCLSGVLHSVLTACHRPIVPVLQLHGMNPLWVFCSSGLVTMSARPVVMQSTLSLTLPPMPFTFTRCGPNDTWRGH